MKTYQTLTSIRLLKLTMTLLVCLFFSQNALSQNVVVSGALTGNGSYPDLNSAFVAINSGAQTSANITVNIVANTTETASAVLNAGAWTSLSITPSGGVLQTISGSIAGPLVDLNGADNVSINGLNSGGNALTLTNTDVGNALTTTLRFVSDASNNVVSNCTLLGSATAATLGVISFSTAATTGNNSNTITNCNIAPSGANMPVNAVLSIGSAGFNNTNNTISNCNISDFFSATLASRGILAAANNTDWIITGNRFYQSGLRIYTTANTHGAIQVTSGNNYVVSNNIIGYATNSATGTYSMTSTIASLFVGINLAVGTATASSVQGNTISAISLTTSSGAATTNGILCGINVTAGNVNIGNINSNLIGGTTGTDLISGNPTTTGGMVVGINSSSTGTMVIQNNYIGGLTSSGTTAAITGGVTGINISGIATGLNISNNTIGNPSPNNMRCGTLGLSTGNSAGSGINVVSTLTATNIIISGNLIQNISSWGFGTTCYVRGIWGSLTSSAGIFSILNNTITNLTSNNSNATIGTGQIGTAGIIWATGTTCTISGNYISNIANTGTATTHVIVGGISNANGTNTVIRFNRIWNISNNSPGTTITTPPVAAGIVIRSGNSGLLIHNNMISLGNGQSSNTTFMGIYGNHGSTPNPTVQAYYNNINIEGVVTAGALPSFGIGRTDFSATARVAPYDVRNNIITNNRSGGTGAHYAIANNFGVAASSITGWGTNATNYNVLNANAATVGWWTGSQTFASWKTSSNGDANSHSGITVTYSNSANDLHLNMGLTPTTIESGAQAIAGITTDIDNQVRPGPAGSLNGGGLNPDIGADEIDGAPATCTAATGGTITPASGSACSGQTIAATSVSVSTGLGIAHQWQVGATPGGPYVNVTGGSGATTPSYTSAPLTTGIYYVILRTTCNASIASVSNEVTLTVISTPSVSASSTTTLICSGQNLSLTGTPGTGTSFSWSGPNGFSSTSQNTVVTNASINASGTYSFTSSANGCTSTPSSVSATVNASPTSLTLTPSSSSICSGSSQTLGVIGGDVPGGALSFTPQTNQNTATTYPAPYSVYYGGQKTQFLILASELTAAGLVAGPLTSIQFPVVSLGANWGVSLTSCQNFQVSVGHTALTSVGATFQAGLTIVKPASNFTPTVGYNNVHNFSPTFSWDGVSNLIVETVFSNNLSGVSADAVIQYNSPTPFQSTMVYRADGVPFATIAAAASTNIATTLIRPDFILKGQTLGTFTWSPALGLSATSGPTVNATPLTTSVYTVQVSAGTCSTATSGSIDVTPIPTLSIAPSASAVCSGNSATLTASGATSYSWSTNTTSSSIVVTPNLSTVYTVSNQTTPCPIVSASINIAVNASPNVSAVSSSSALCFGTTGTLTANGATSYIWSAGSNASTQTISPTSNSVYTVTGTDANGCSANTTVSVVSHPLPSVAVSPPAATICLGESVNMTASGAATYSWLPVNSGSVLISVSPVANTVYTVTGTDANNCSNTSSASVVVDICTGLSNFADNKKQILVYPNPSSGVITTQFEFEGRKEILVTNSVGAVIEKIESENTLENIDLSEKAKGVYYIKISAGTNSFNYKVIIH